MSVRFGLVGQGSWGRQHARAIREEGGTLAWVVGRGPVPTPEIAASGIPYYAGFDLDALPPVDVVVLAVPNHLHAPFARAALAHGCHVLVEKPLATRLEDAEQVVAEARAAGRLLAVGYEMRFSPLWSTVRDEIRERLADWRWLDLSLDRHPFRPGRGAWRHNPALVGDWMIEEAVHHLDLLGWLGGDHRPVEVFAEFPGDPPPLADLLSARLAFPSGRLVTYRAALSGAGHHLAFSAYGPGRSLSAQWHGVTDRTTQPHFSVEWRAAGVPAPIPVPAQSGEVYELNREIRAVMAAVTEHRPLWITPDEALWSLRLADALTRSGIEGRPIALDRSP